MRRKFLGSKVTASNLAVGRIWLCCRPAIRLKRSVCVRRVCLSFAAGRSSPRRRQSFAALVFLTAPRALTFASRDGRENKKTQPLQLIFDRVRRSPRLWEYISRCGEPEGVADLMTFIVSPAGAGYWPPRNLRGRF